MWQRLRGERRTSVVPVVWSDEKYRLLLKDFLECVSAEWSSARLQDATAQVVEDLRRLLVGLRQGDLVGVAAKVLGKDAQVIFGASYD